MQSHTRFFKVALSTAALAATIAVALPSRASPAQAQGAPPIAPCQSTDTIVQVAPSVYTRIPAGGTLDTAHLSPALIHCYGLDDRGAHPLPAQMRVIVPTLRTLPEVQGPSTLHGVAAGTDYNCCWTGYGVRSADNGGKQFSESYAFYPVISFKSASEPYTQDDGTWTGTGGDNEGTNALIWQDGWMRNISPSGVSASFAWMENFNCVHWNASCPYTNVTAMGNAPPPGASDTLFSASLILNATTCEADVEDYTNQWGVVLYDTACVVNTYDLNSAEVVEEPSGYQLSGPSQPHGFPGYNAMPLYYNIDRPSVPGSNTEAMCVNVLSNYISMNPQFTVVERYTGVYNCSSQPSGYLPPDGFLAGSNNP